MSLPNGELPDISGVCDSKILNETQREEVYEKIIKAFPADRVKAVVIPSTKIDEVNILEATFLGMTEAVDTLFDNHEKTNQPELVLVDGPHIPREWKAEEITGTKREGRGPGEVKVEAVVKGDGRRSRRVLSCTTFMADPRP